MLKKNYKLLIINYIILQQSFYTLKNLRHVVCILKHVVSSMLLNLILINVTMLGAIYMLNMSKVIKIGFILFLIVSPFYQNYSYSFFKYGSGALSWVIMVKCLKSFSVDTGDTLNNILYTIRDLRLKQYDVKKKFELKHNVKYLSNMMDVLYILVLYHYLFLVLLYIQNKFQLELRAAYIESFNGVEYIGRKIVYTLFYGITLSTFLQHFALGSSALFILLSKLVFKLSKLFCNNKHISNFFEDYGYEVGDQRPYFLFNRPLLITGVASFWSESWHAVLRDIFVPVSKSIYKKASKKLKTALALMAFLFSGIFHAYLILVCTHQFSSESFCFFLIQGCAVLIEYAAFKIIGKHTLMGRIFGVLFGNFVLVATCQLFVESVKALNLFGDMYEFYIDLPLKFIFNKNLH